jgi:hypothetical protein
MLRLSALACLLALPLTACGKRPSEVECLEVLDRYTEMLAREESPALSAGDLTRMREAARVRARHDPAHAFARCPAQVTRRQLDCALEAPTVDSIERCLIL